MSSRSSKQARKLHQERTEPSELRPKYNGAGEAEVVPGFQLSEVLRKWIVEYLDGRPISGNLAERRRKGGIRFYGPIQYLADHTGINARRVSGICNGEFSMVPLSQADALLQAIEQTDFLDKEIQVVPNPNWSPERWLAYMEERGCV